MCHDLWLNAKCSGKDVFFLSIGGTVSTPKEESSFNNLDLRTFCSIHSDVCWCNYSLVRQGEPFFKRCTRLLFIFYFTFILVSHAWLHILPQTASHCDTHHGNCSTPPSMAFLRDSVCSHTISTLQHRTMEKGGGEGVTRQPPEAWGQTRIGQNAEW